MPAPTVATYSAAALVAAHTALRDLIDSGSGAGAVKIRSSADALLASLPLTDPCGTVNGTTGQISLAFASSGVAASAGGVAAYAEICDSTGAVHLALPAVAGSGADNGKIVFNTLTIVEGAPVDIISATIG